MSRSPTHRPRSRTAVGLSVVMLVAATVLGPTTGVAAAAASSVPVPSEDAFYRAPNPLPDGRPGDVIRSRAVSVNMYGLPVPVRAWQVLYRSTSATGAPIAVSGTVLVPITKWSDGDRPVVAYGVGGHGHSDVCAPSYKLRTGSENEIVLMGSLLLRGWAVAVTDYEGLGTPLGHTQAVGQSAGRSMLDAARAAQRLPEAGLSQSARVGLFGYSQGGQASLWGGELQPTYAPELDLVGIAAGAAPRDIVELGRIHDGGPFAGLIVAVMLGFHYAYPDLPFDEVLTERGRELVARIADTCVIDTSMLAAAFTRIRDLTTLDDPFTHPQWAARVAENVPGHQRPDAPVLYYHGAWDELILYSASRPVVDDYCALGATVQFRTIPFIEHIIGAVVGVEPAARWLADRFDAKPVDSGC